MKDLAGLVKVLGEPRGPPADSRSDLAPSMSFDFRQRWLRRELSQRGNSSLRKRISARAKLGEQAAPRWASQLFLTNLQRWKL